MDIKVIFGIIGILIVNVNSQNENTKEKLKLNLEQKKILKEYKSFAKLDYGDKCNFELESNGNELRQNLRPYLRKVLKLAIEQDIDYDEFILSSSLEDTRNELFAEMEEFTYKIQNISSESDSVVSGICNDTKSLYCDQNAGECRCGFAIKTEGFYLTNVDGECKFDLYSGCIQPEFSGFTTLECIEGSTCVTSIEESNCTLTNSLHEASKYPIRFQRITKKKGHTCFCDL